MFFGEGNCFPSRGMKAKSEPRFNFVEVFIEFFLYHREMGIIQFKKCVRKISEGKLWNTFPALCTKGIIKITKIGIREGATINIFGLIRFFLEVNKKK